MTADASALARRSERGVMLALTGLVFIVLGIGGLAWGTTQWAETDGTRSCYGDGSGGYTCVYSSGGSPGYGPLGTEFVSQGSGSPTFRPAAIKLIGGAVLLAFGVVATIWGALRNRRERFA